MHKGRFILNNSFCDTLKNYNNNVVFGHILINSTYIPAGLQAQSSHSSVEHTLFTIANLGP